MEELIYNIFNVLNISWDIFKNWWWVPLPFILFGNEKKAPTFIFMWLWWRRELWIFAQKFVLLEIKMPKEVLKPLRSMDQVFSSIWGNIYDPADWWEKWFEGKVQLSFKLEIASLGGETHFYIRCHESRKVAVEASIYSQYPDVEISVAEDYVKYVPQDSPNKDWEMWGSDYTLARPDVYPIKTYPKFFEEKPEIAKEEKRIDPMATLLEGMSTMKPGEQLWIQISASPVTNKDNNFVDRGREIADKLARRPDKEAPKSILAEASRELAFGTMPGGEEKKEESIIPVEMKLTPGEREVVAAVEDKVAKRCFDSYFRFLYVAKRDVYFGGAKAIPFGYFQQFATENLNQPLPWGKTITKIHHYPILDIIRERRLFVRKRRLFWRYVNRHSPLYPATKIKDSFILNTEELATLYHFPGRAVSSAPFVARVEAKKGEAPPGLPMED